MEKNGFTMQDLRTEIADAIGIKISEPLPAVDYNILSSTREVIDMKKYVAILLTFICVLGLAGCDNKSMNYIISNKPSVTGVVEEVHEDYVIMYSETAEGYPYGSHWKVSLNVENQDSYTDLVIGDEIVVYYDGLVMETEPLQMGTVYAITLKEPADRMIDDKADETEPSVVKTYEVTDSQDAFENDEVVILVKHYEMMCFFE